MTTRRIEISEPDARGNRLIKVHYDGCVYEGKQVARSGGAIGFGETLPADVCSFIHEWFAASPHAVFDSVPNYDLLA